MTDRGARLLEQLEAGLARVDGEIELSAWAGRLGTTRFAASQPTQTGEVEEVKVQVRVALGTRVGTACCGSADADAIRVAAGRARAAAEAQPRGDDTFPGFTDGSDAATPVEGAWDEATAVAGPGDRAALLARAFATTGELGASGLLAVVDGAQAVATRGGARRSFRYTTFKLDLIAAGESDPSSGFAAYHGHAAAGCDVEQLARTARDKALAGRDPIALPPGEYDVILEPHATCEMLEWLGFTSLGARPFVEGTSAFSGHLGQAVTGSQITLHDDGRDPDPIALRAPFDAEGTPKRRVVLLDEGVARGVIADRAGAARYRVPATGHAAPIGEEVLFDNAAPQHLHLAAGPDRAEDLLARVERGLWVTRFHYVNGLLDTRRSLMTGMTRDGLFLVEDGRVGRGVRNLRFTESLLEALARVAGITRERRAVAALWSSASSGGLVAPTLLIRNFHFTGTTGA